MPRKYDKPPAWAHKRKLSEEFSQPPAMLVSEPRSTKRARTEARPVYTKPFSTVDRIDKAAKDLRGWMLDDKGTDEDCFRYVRNIVDLCHAEPPGCRMMSKFVAHYRSIGAPQHDVDDLYQSLEPFWTRAAFANPSRSIADKATLVDVMRTILIYADQSHGPLLEPSLKADLTTILDRIAASTAMDNPDVKVRTTTAGATEVDNPSNSPPKPPALLVSTDNLAKPTAVTRHEPHSPKKLNRSETNAVGMMTPISASSLTNEVYKPITSNPPHLPPTTTNPQVNLPKYTRNVLADSPSKPSEKSTPPRSEAVRRESADLTLPTPASCPVYEAHAPVTAKIGRPSGTTSESRVNQPNLSETLLANSPAKSLKNSSPISPDVLGRHSFALSDRIQTESNEKKTETRAKRVSVTSKSGSATRRTSSVTSSSSKVPASPRSSFWHPRGSYEAKIWPHEEFYIETRSTQHKAILVACEVGRIIGIRDVSFQKDDSWILQFKDLRSLEKSMGLFISLDGVQCLIRPHFPDKKFQMFAATTAKDFHADDLINAVAKYLYPYKFALQGKPQKQSSRWFKWLASCEEPIEKDNFDIRVFYDTKRHDVRLPFWAVPSELSHCHICLHGNHISCKCPLLHNVGSQDDCKQYLDRTPELKDIDRDLLNSPLRPQTNQRERHQYTK